MQGAPVCFNCDEAVSAADAVFEAPCGHDEHPSAVWHGLCLMEWRENHEAAMRIMQTFMADMEEFMGGLSPEEDQ